MSSNFLAKSIQTSILGKSRKRIVNISSRFIQNLSQVNDLLICNFHKLSTLHPLPKLIVNTGVSLCDCSLRPKIESHFSAIFEEEFLNIENSIRIIIRVILETQNNCCGHIFFFYLLCYA